MGIGDAIRRFDVHGLLGQGILPGGGVLKWATTRISGGEAGGTWVKEIVEPKTLPTAKAPSRARQQVKTGDGLVSTTRPNLNAVAVVPLQLDGAIASTGFAVLRPLLLEPRWLYSVVQSEDFVAEMSGLVPCRL